jgi:hypothetical protein
MDESAVLIVGLLWLCDGFVVQNFLRELLRVSGVVQEVAADGEAVAAVLAARGELVALHGLDVPTGHADEVGVRDGGIGYGGW